MYKILLLIFVVLFTSEITKAQQWIIYGGLPNITTRRCAVDDSLNVWVTNFSGGLSKVFNSNYINYNSSNSGLTDNYTTGIAIDASNNKWIGTYNSGVFNFNGTTWTIYNTGNGLPGTRINCVTIDNNNNKWFGINFNGATKYDGTTFTTYKTTNSPLPNNNVNCITTESNGNVWIGTYNGLAKLNGTNWTIYTVGSTSAENQIYSIAVESPTCIWVGTGGGLWKFDGNSTWVSYNTGNSSLPYDYVNCVEIDQNNKKWIGTTQGGMAQFDGISTWTVYNTTNSQIPGMDIRGITVDVNNNLWITTNDGGLAFYGTPPVVGPSTDATLSDLKVDGVTVPSFQPTTFIYNTELPYGTTIIPTVTATTNHNLATMIITDATSLPGSATVEVTAEDGTTSLTYSINFTIASPSTEATLSDLKVNGTTVAGFSPSIFSYGVVFPYGTTQLPIITAITTDANATKIITDASSLPGSGTVEVTAQDGITTNTYTLNFTLAPANTDASLSDLQINGITVIGFSPSTYDYNVELPYGTTIVPTVTATPNFINASAQITNAPSLPGSTTILVTAEDGITTLTYNIHFTIATGIIIAPSLKTSAIYPNPAIDIANISFDQNTQTIQAIVYNNLGKEVFNKNLEINTSLLKLNVSELSNGLYTFMFFDEKGNIIFKDKFVVNHK